MKKIFVCRLIAFILLCFISIAIKSETFSCKIMCSSIPENNSNINLVKPLDYINNIDYKSGPFIIKI
jgi:hypothetical protein